MTINYNLICEDGDYLDKLFCQDFKNTNSIINLVIPRVGEKIEVQNMEYEIKNIKYLYDQKFDTNNIFLIGIEIDLMLN